MEPPHTCINHPDSATSSPRSTRPDTSDDHPLPHVPGAKLRFMCSYGGHIIPRPHDKSLCYVGGDTRIVVVDRHSSLADFHSRLSHSVLNGRNFTLKYQLPNEDLDSLISLATDEDLENMIEEYDRTTLASPLKPSRLRLFLFPSKPETAASMGCLLDDAKSETWFVDALNGSGLLPRGLSESAAIDNLLELNSDSCTDIEAQSDLSLGNINKQVVGKSNAQEVFLMETSSSFGSSSSSPSMANLPPIKVRVEDYQMVGLDEQFTRHVGIAASLPCDVSPVPVPTCVGVKSSGYDGKSASEHWAAAAAATATGLRKPPLPLQTVQRKFVDIHNLPSPDSKHALSGGFNLPSPDSVKSDCSIASAGSLSHHTIYQDASQLVNRSPSPVIDQKMTNIQDPITTTTHHNISVQHQHEQQQQLIDHQNQQYLQHPNTQQTTHYIPHSPVPMSSYYPIYVSPQTQQPIQHQTHHHDPQQYPIYFAPQTQPPPNTTTMLPSYQTTNGAGAGATQMYVQIQQPYVAHSQMARPSAQPNGNMNYGYEYGHSPMQEQMYYAQHMTMTPATAALLSHQSSAGDNNNAPQQS